MNINIEINPDGSAFEDNLRSELIYVLGFARGMITESMNSRFREISNPLFDSNGNRCGWIEIERCSVLEDLLQKQRARKLRDPEQGEA